MSAITVTPEVVSILAILKETTEIRDAKGRTIGTFTPQAVAEEERLKSMFNLAEAERVRSVDPVELKRREESDEKRFTFEEVMQHLRSLETLE